MITVGTWNLENLFRPNDGFGPNDKAVYDAKLAALATTINTAGPDVLGVQEVGQPRTRPGRRLGLSVSAGSSEVRWRAGLPCRDR